MPVVQIFFRSCVHDSGRMQEAGGRLVALMRASLGAWWAEGHAAWAGRRSFPEALARVQADLLVNVFFETWLVRDATDSNYMIAVTI